MEPLFKYKISGGIAGINHYLIVFANGYIDVYNPNLREYSAHIDDYNHFVNLYEYFRKYGNKHKCDITGFDILYEYIEIDGIKYKICDYNVYPTQIKDTLQYLYKLISKR